MRAVLLVLLSVLVVTQGLDVWKLSRDFMYDDDNEEEADFSWIEGGTIVVKDGTVTNEWTQNAKARDGEDIGVSYFLFDVKDNEKFGPLEYGVVGADVAPDANLAKGAGDQQFQMIVLGDAFAGNFHSQEPILQAKVVYSCIAPFKDKLLYLRLSLLDQDVTDGPGVRNVTWYWHKSCGSGPRKGFNVGVSEFPSQYYDVDDDAEEDVVDFAADDEEDGEQSYDFVVVEDGQAKTAWDYSNPTHRFEHAFAPDFLLSIQKGYGSQVYGSPRIEVGDPSLVKVTMVDTHDANHNILSEFTENSVVTVIQTCLKTAGETKISMTIDLGSHDPVRFSWIKSCDIGKSILHIQTNRLDHKPDVVEGNVVTAEYNSSNPKHRAPATEVSSTFWFKTTGTASMTFDKVYAIAKPRDILTAIVSPKKFNANSQATAVTVDYRCLSKGTAQVTMVIIPGAHVDPIKFTWFKECPKRIRTVQQGYMTANRAMFLFCFVTLVVGLLGGYTWIQWKRRKIAERRARLQQQNTIDS